MVSIVRIKSVERKPSGRFQITGTLHQGELGWDTFWTTNDWVASLCQIAVETRAPMRLTWTFDPSARWKQLVAVEDVSQPSSQGAA